MGVIKMKFKKVLREGLKFNEWLELQNIDNFEWEKIVPYKDKYEEVIKAWKKYLKFHRDIFVGDKK